MDLILIHINKILTIFILIIISIGIRIFLQFLGQKWITTTAHTSTVVLLPILTYIITNVIAGNIALSLGMVGALSIVRFRNPVRSPLELSVYFGSITMGIAAYVSILWLGFFVGAIVLAAISLLICNYIYQMIYQKSFFTTSFSEGNSLSTLDVKSSSPIEELDKNKFLTFKQISNKEYNYSLASDNFEKLVEIQNSLTKDQNIITSQINK